MNLSSNASDNEEAIHVIRDIQTLIGIIIAFFAPIAFVIYAVIAGNDAISLYVLGAVVISTFAFFLFLANKDGYVLDFTDKTFEFPGGGLSANSLTDYINKDFVLQLFKRIKVSLNDIQQLSNSMKISRNKEGRKSYKYYLHINGTFGAAKLSFNDENKRDQVSALIIQTNQMGAPISNR